MPNSNSLTTTYNILVTGSMGQLGSEIKELSSNYNYNFFFTTKDDIDITSKDSIKEFCQTNSIKQKMIFAKLFIPYFMKKPLIFGKVTTSPYVYFSSKLL